MADQNPCIDVTPYLNKSFIKITEDMFAYYDGEKVRKNRKFLKGLWRTLPQKVNPTIGDVLKVVDTSYSENTKRMITSNIKRGGWVWLEGINDDVFGDVFANEYIRRWREKNISVEDVED
ncbi:MAG: hypothetical protein U9R24_05165 [Thermodesulfobacteriota bacterium]|nr:hypothetical protein [Thermodesulfobacteriota bacterium]